MALDHGILNTPLEKRGNFHKELDDQLAAEAAKKKREFQDAKFLHEEARKEAWRMFELIDKRLLKHHADKRSMTSAELKSVVRSMCNDRPKAALKVLELFVKAT